MPCDIEEASVFGSIEHSIKIDSVEACMADRLFR